MSKVEVNSRGIKNRLKAVKPFRAIAEYVWNGFDAHAVNVSIDYSCDEVGNILFFSISDDGKGVSFDSLKSKFKPLLSSEKREKEAKGSLVHGKNGVGRLTFYHFAQFAKWETAYEKNGEVYFYEINVDEASIDQYDNSEPVRVNDMEAGTKVSFFNVGEISDYYIENDVKSYLEKEFSWFLELNKRHGFSLKVNQALVNQERLIKDVEVFDLNVEGSSFSVKYVRWSKKLNKHSSRYYFLDEGGRFKYSKPTSFNNKGDGFYHSVYISGDFFNYFDTEGKGSSEDLIGFSSPESKEFKSLLVEVNSFLRSKRKPFVVDYAKTLVEVYESEGVFPEFDSRNRYEVMKSEDLKEAVKQLYQLDPRIFNSLNKTQKKTFVSFLSLVMEGGEVDSLFEVLKGVIDLSSDEREVFARQLKTTRMSSIVRTIELISDRFKSVDEFKKLVFEPDMYAGEIPHLQKMMEKNYWLIGEEYQLLTAAEPKFEEALRRHSYILRGEKEKREMTHEDKNREMDLFLVRQDKKNKKIQNVVVELKHPFNVRLGKKELDQVYDYYQVIKSEPMFNGRNMEWKFYLVGNKFDGTGYIQDQIDALKFHGEAGLAHLGEYKIYVFTWSEVFAEFEMRHNFLNNNLKLELDKLDDGEHLSADEIVEAVRSSDAPSEITVPS